ncbi:hypothetical protein H7I00_00015, partial [Mycobacterium bohemicum]|nr:hypothetical protein [Mycobacterium bohemicum]
MNIPYTAISAHAAAEVDLVPFPRRPEHLVVAATIDDMIEKREAFSTRHRIIDTAGMVHDVI